ncbi:MAG: hypothetical protein DHS20C14_03440 [Phycisphaeraceae bacterium]|nr:MAG: hypothetical protein DHS20C14_03440 [Phycisphaeraceae bacterium]
MHADPRRDADSFDHDPLNAAPAQGSDPLHHDDTTDPWMPAAEWEPKPFRFNRRAGVRRRIEGEAMASGYGFGGAVVTEVKLVDASVNGIGLDSPVPFEVGTEIELRFNGQPRVGRCGQVARCDEHATGWRIGIETDAGCAAA